MTLGQRLKKLREERGLTADQLSDELKLLKTVIWGFEMGKKEPTVSQLMKYAEYFGVSMDYLMGREAVGVHGERIEERPIEEEIKRVFVMLDGEEVTEEEITEALAYIKAKRMMKEALYR